MLLYDILLIQVHHCAAACPPFPDGSCSADTHLRNIFYRLGITLHSLKSASVGVICA